MINQEQVARIRRLFYAEHWKIGTIATELGVHPDTVKRAIGSERFNSRLLQGSKVDPYLEFIREILEQHPRLRATRLYQMVCDRGYQGSVGQLRRAVRPLRPTRRESFLKLVTLPGEQGQCDWASFGEIVIGRAHRRLSCFVMTLSWSRALWLEFFVDQSMENFLRGHVNAFNDWGGAPRTIAYDNLKSVVLERYGQSIRFHPRILDLCGHYHFAARPCNVGRGNEKGRIERAIRYARDSFFAGRSFSGLEDLNRQARTWRDTIAHNRPCPADDARTVREVFLEEQPRLIPLPSHPFETDVVKTVRSGKTVYVRFDLNDYSIPPEAVGRLLTLVASPATVRLLDGSTLIASHHRSYDRHQRIDDPAHIAKVVEQKRKALGATATSMLSNALPNIEEFLKAAFERGESVSRQTTQLLALLDDYGPDAVRAAVAEALQRQTPRATSVAFILARRKRQSNSQVLPVEMSRHPELALLRVPTPKLEIYDDLSEDERDDDGSAG